MQCKGKHTENEAERSREKSLKGYWKSRLEEKNKMEDYAKKDKKRGELEGGTKIERRQCENSRSGWREVEKEYTKREDERI